MFSPSTIILIQVISASVHHPQLLQRNENDHCRRSSANHSRRQSLEHEEMAFVHPGQLESVNYAQVRSFGSNDPSLDDIDRVADERSQKTSAKTGRNVQWRCICHSSVGKETSLENVVPSKLSHGRKRTSASIDPDATPDTAPSFRANHFVQAVCDVLVTISFLCRMRKVVLHSCADDVGEISYNTTAEAGHGGDGG